MTTFLQLGVSIYLVYTKLYLNFWILGMQPNFRESLIFTSLVTLVKNSNKIDNNSNSNNNDKRIFKQINPSVQIVQIVKAKTKN